jgi:hypothetical protein
MYRLARLVRVVPARRPNLPPFGSDNRVVMQSPTWRAPLRLNQGRALPSRGHRLREQVNAVGEAANGEENRDHGEQERP